LRYGLDWPERDIARQLGVVQSTVAYRLAEGVGRIVGELNGHVS
jgi:predicted DNA binding protein